MGKLEITLSGMEMKNPLIPASGTFGYGLDFQDFFDVNLCGSLSIKGTTLYEREGNPLPRIAEYGGGMINSVGLQNPGVNTVVTELLPALQQVYHGRILANISGFSVDEYVETAKRFDSCDIVGILELNISCPNVHGGGMSFGMDPEAACEVVKAVKKETVKPLYVKCTPQCPDLVGMCIALEEAGADGLVLLNTWMGMRIDWRTGKPILANTTGGVSGPGIFPQTLYKIYQVYPHVHIPIIGCGGVSDAEEVIEMMSAGASAVEIGTAGLINPLTVPDILADLTKIVDTLHIESLTEIIGRSHR